MAMFMLKRTNKLSELTERLFRTEIGCIIVSALFGVSLAFMFQKVCKGNECIINKSPPQDEITNYVYQNDGEYYKYKIKVVEC